MNPKKKSRKDNDGSSSECHQPSKKQRSAPIFDEIINNPGLQHIMEKIFLNLDFADILACQLINKSCKEIVDNPMFWLKKWRLRGLSEKNHKNWTQVIQLTRGTLPGSCIYFYIKEIIKQNSLLVDVPCLIDEQDILNINFWQCIKKISIIIKDTQYDNMVDIHVNEEVYKKVLGEAIKNGNAGLIQLLAPLMKNPNPAKT